MQYKFNFNDHDFTHSPRIVEWFENALIDGKSVKTTFWGSARVEFTDVDAKLPNATMTMSNHVTALFEALDSSFLALVRAEGAQMEFRVYARPDCKIDIVKHLKEHFQPVDKSKYLRWYFNSSRGMSYEELPLSGKDPLPEFYPWIPDLYKLYDEFSASTANVMLLIGPPGTGKTTFIRGLLRRSSLQAWVTYDEKVQNDDALYIQFATIDGKRRRFYEDIDDDYLEDKTLGRMLVLEDSDSLLESRKEGNFMMNRLLNMSDGLVSLPDRKLVFSTNLPSLSSVDPAILRPGRCFAVINFRRLNGREAWEAHRAVYPTSDRGFNLQDKYTLAEVLNDKRGDDVQTIRKIGFA